MSITEEVSQLIKEPLQEMKVRIFEITYQREGKDMVLRILVERIDDHDISLEEIVSISEKISLLLDEKDLIADNYMLDVASSGAEHPIRLEELSLYIDRYVHIHLTNPLEGENIYEGTLKSVDEENVSLEIKIKTRIKNVLIARKNIDSARLAIKF